MTVAAVIQRDGRFLFVEEQTDEGVRINQPAGHLEPDESILEAVVRETLEETAYGFSPHGAGRRIIAGAIRPGIVTYVRFAFCGESGPAPRRSRRSITASCARSGSRPKKLRACAPSHRSPLVLRCVEDYLAGRRYPLDLLIHYA